MEKREDLKKELIESLECLKYSFYALNDVWDKINSCKDTSLSDYMIEGMPSEFPFPKSFDEFCTDVSDWVEKRVDDLENPCFYNRKAYKEIMDNFSKLSKDEQRKALEDMAKKLNP